MLQLQRYPTEIQQPTNSYFLIPAGFLVGSMTDQAGNWKIHVKKGSYEVEVEGPNPERVEKMFDELVKKYMKKIASP
jgi:hypothetical protein